MSQRIPAIDYLRVALVTGVAFAHTALITADYSRGMLVFGNGLLRCLVPTFAIISGVGLYHTMKRGRLFGWLTGIVILYLVWCLIYAPFWLPGIENAGQFLRTVFVGPIHLWYLSALAEAGLALGIVIKLADGRQNAIAYVAGSVLLMALVSTVLGYGRFYNWTFIPDETPLHRVLYLYPFVGTGYLLGMWLQTKNRDDLPRASVLWGMTALFGALRLLEAYLATPSGYNAAGYPPEFPPLLYLLPVALFLACYRTNLPKVGVDLASMSIMIYVVHFGVIIALVHFGINAFWVVYPTSVIIPAILVVLTPGVPWSGKRRMRAQAAEARPREG